MGWIGAWTNTSPGTGSCQREAGAGPEPEPRAAGYPQGIMHTRNRSRRSCGLGVVGVVGGGKSSCGWSRMRGSSLAGGGWTAGQGSLPSGVDSRRRKMKAEG